MEGLPGKMIMYTAVMLGTDEDPRFTLRTGSAFIQASEDNVGKIMMDLEQSKKSSAQLKDTLRKEREESNRLKRKYEDVQREMKSSRAEVQALQVEMQVKETTQEALEKVQKECQDLKSEKGQLLAKVEELEEQLKILLQENDMHTQELRKEHQEQISSLTTALEVARE